MASSNQTDAVIIEVGGLEVGLEGLGEELRAQVAARYALFLGEGVPRMRIAVRDGGSGEHRPLGAPEITRTGERAFHIVYGSLTAQLDLAAGTGEVNLPSSIWLVDSLLRMTVGLMLSERGGLLVHASGVRIGAGALVCFGPSGVGKTTVARSAAPADVLCDEMIALVPDGAGVRAFGTPFHGDYDVCAPLSAPLAALVRLVQGPADLLEPLSPARAAQALLNCTLFFCRDEAVVDALLSAAFAICTRGAYRLTFKRGTHVPTFVSNRLGLAAAAPGAQAARAGDGR